MPELDGTFWFLESSALAAGIVNAVAGGGTLLTFPALLAVISPVQANATSTVALVPGSLAGGWGYRREFRSVQSLFPLLAWPSLLGGLLGSLLVVRLDPHYFSMMVPWLMLTAAMVFLMQPLFGKLVVNPGWISAPPRALKLAICSIQFFVGVYGGYFGAGIGILMLASLGLLGLRNIHSMNALKAVLAALINGISVVVFALHQEVVWSYAFAMAMAAIVGGFLGASVARRLNPTLVRWTVVLIGLGVSAYYFYKQQPIAA
jgi:uncharacterized membrane protein YfcA